MFAGLQMAASQVGRITEAITDGKISLLLVGSGDVKGLRFTAPC